MSTQLSIYPQNYQGQYSWTSTVSPQNLVGDDTWFWANVFFSVTDCTSGAPNHEAMTTAGGEPIISFWKGYRTTGGSFTGTDAPSVAGVWPSTYLILPSTAGGSVSGAYQLITGLTVGFVYDVEINFNNSCTGTFSIAVLNAINGWWHNSTFYRPINTGAEVNPTSTTNYVASFTATDTDMVFAMNWDGTGDDLQINRTSIKQSQLSQTVHNVSDGQEVLDMYDHQSIPITLRIDDFKKIAEKPQSYSKAFKLPGTKHNNRIFANIFDVTTSVHGNNSTFNPYVISKAVLKEDGHNVFEGYLKILEIKNKDSEIIYNVNLFSDAISLKQRLGKLTFADLDNQFDELYHVFTKASIKPSWRGQLPLINALPSNYTGFAGDPGDTTTNVLKYPFCRYNGGITQQVGGGQTGWPEINDMPNAFRPWIRIKYLLDRIIHEAGFTYQSDFINGTGRYDGTGTPAITRKHPDFKRLFMDFNWGSNIVADTYKQEVEITYVRDAAASNNQMTGTTWHTIEFNQNEAAVADHGWVAADDRIVAPFDNMHYTITYEVEIENTSSGNGNTQYDVRLVHLSSTGSHINTLSSHLNNTPGTATVIKYSGTGDAALDQNERIELQCKRDFGTLYQKFSDPSEESAKLIITAQPRNMDSTTLLAKRGKIKQWDFVKDILTMFNLIVLKDKEDQTKLRIEPYEDIFVNTDETTDITQVKHDWTNKVDEKMFDVKFLKLKQDVFWNYAKDEKDYAKKVYKDATSYDFGNMQTTTDSSLPNAPVMVHAGEQKLQLKVFASTFCTPLFSNFNHNLTVPQLTASKDDGSITGQDNKPRILYDVSGDVAAHTDLPELPGGRTYQLPSFNGVTGEAQSYFCQFLHITDFPSVGASRDLNLGTHQIIDSMVHPNGGTLRNIFNEYWAPYYDELYNSDTKSVKFKVLLSAYEISVINFYDIIIIKNREYRINKIDYKSGELSTVELILIP